jgi:hypothetical protein
MTDKLFRPKLLLLGPGRHGKDTVAEMLRDEFGLQFISSSLFAAERVMMPYFDSIGIQYLNVEECFADRHREWVEDPWWVVLWKAFTGGELKKGSNRAVWYDQIMAHNSPDKAKLAREIMSNSDIYVGMRSAEEFKASTHLFDYIIWVDASGRGVPMEDTNSMSIAFDPGSMWKINNDGTLENLREQVRTFGEQVLGFKHKEWAHAT